MCPRHAGASKGRRNPKRKAKADRPETKKGRKNTGYNLRDGMEVDETEAGAEAPAEFSAKAPPEIPAKDDKDKKIWRPRTPAIRPRWNVAKYQAVYTRHVDKRTVTLPRAGKMVVYRCGKPGCDKYCPRFKRERDRLARVRAELLEDVDGIEVTRDYCDVQHLKPWRKYCIKNTIKRSLEVEGVTLEYYREKELSTSYHTATNLAVWCKTCNRSDSKSGKGESAKMLPEWVDG